MFLSYRKFSTGRDTKSRVPSTFQPDFAARCVNHSLQSLKDTYEIPADALFLLIANDLQTVSFAQRDSTSNGPPLSFLETL